MSCDNTALTHAIIYCICHMGCIVPYTPLCHCAIYMLLYCIIALVYYYHFAGDGRVLHEMHSIQINWFDHPTKLVVLRLIIVSADQPPCMQNEYIMKHIHYIIYTLHELLLSYFGFMYFFMPIRNQCAC